MNLEDIDLVKWSKLASQHIEQVTCLECCKFYIAPETVACGHTLCHNCWRGRKQCPVCTTPVERKQHKLNLPLQKLTGHVQDLGEAFENLFNVKLDEFRLDSDELESGNDPAKNVKYWLASSENHFSGPAQSSDLSSQELKQKPNPMDISKIQIHTTTKKTISPEKVVLVSIPQDDWDKIETMPATEDVNKNKENIIGPVDLEPFYTDVNEYPENHPRRSSRRLKDIKNNNANLNTTNNSFMDKENTKDSSGEMDKKSSSAKQNWNNVKRMRKEFSKLNKINKSKLNVSIEMAKKKQGTAKPIDVIQNASIPVAYEIDENTPKLTPNDLPNVEMTKVISSNHTDCGNNNITNSKETANDNIQAKCNAKDIPNQISNNMSQSVLDHTQQRSILSNHVMETSLPNKDLSEKDNQVKMPFYKKSALCTSDCTDKVQKQSNQIKSAIHNIESRSNGNEDIKITIEVGNTITNIVIKKKNDVQLKVNTDRKVQTSLCPENKGDTSSQNIETRNVSINIDSNNEVNIEHISQEVQKQVDTDKQMTPEIKKLVSSTKTTSGKKNTASADTATGIGPFEITESIEKKLSDIERAEIEDQQKTKSVPNITGKILQKLATSKTQSNSKMTQRNNKSKPENFVNNSKIMKTPDPVNQEDVEYFNDLDIFESGDVKETNVKLRKNAKNTTPSEILISTACNRNKKQKNEKRDRGNTYENDNDLPTSKKQKLNDTRDEDPTADLSKQNKNQPDSESTNYDSIMGQVFASIDADMEEIKGQNVLDNDNVSVAKEIGKKKLKGTQNIAKGTQRQDAMSGKYVIDCTMNSNGFCSQKDSENIFSVYAEREDVIEASSVDKIDKVTLNEPQPNAEDFLTPVMSTEQSASAALVESQHIEIVNDDSESVVEDTPQKNTSFGKLKQKSIGKDHSSQIYAKTCGKSINTEKNKNINSASSSEAKSTGNVTVIDTRKTSLETPLTINKFVDDIQHNSTPVARKSLNFENEDIDDIDPEQTLCPTNTVAKTTQEKEFMRKAFEKTPRSQVVNPQRRNQKICVAGSCLTPDEIAKLKALCFRHKWSYVDKYTPDLTHLVVGVDEENKAQRSVKYMCALATSKWIVSNEWVQACLETKRIVGEEKYEAFDNTGEPGPRRSRVANRKLFQGITFYCMEPFSILNSDALKLMLEASGGRVVSEVNEVRVSASSSAPALLLAEPENTQEDRFIYLAMELSIVPVNYEWVLNCLGSYTIGSVQELLLCPSSLLPKATEKWPHELIARQDD